MSKEYILKEGSLHDQYLGLRSKIQFFGGGFGNGKTSAMVIKALRLAHDYPGSTGLMARSTYPKLNDTLRKTFLDFCPEDWIKSFALSKNSDNTCHLENGSTINFRYLAQRKSTEDGSSTSNLLSATYDWAVVDQLEDPEIMHKDFLDILGRLRGNTVYRGSLGDDGKIFYDPSMPRSGPRWFLASANPTRNWVYKNVIKPYHTFKKTGRIEDGLLVFRDAETGKHVVDENGNPRLMLEVVEGSTYTNSHILDADFIQGLESAYTGQMKDRFLKGEWAAYEGLVYPDFSEDTHVIRHDRIRLYLADLKRRGIRVTWLEGYDYGIASPSCYLLAFVDHLGNVFVVDGFYRKEYALEDQAREIRNIRRKYGYDDPSFIRADPAVFKRTAGKDIGQTVASLITTTNNDIQMFPGNNDIMSGITKVRSFLKQWPHHVHPIDNSSNAPSMFFSSILEFMFNEFSSYFWKTDSSGEREDIPNDSNDHAMDTLKYLLTDVVERALVSKLQNRIPAYMTDWMESDPVTRTNAHRH